MSAASFSISCATSGAHAFALSGADAAYTLDPATDFAVGETCTVTVDDQGVSDTDADDPPDTMAADRVFSFTTVPLATTIPQVQGAAHLSPLAGRTISVTGVVTAERPSSFTLQDAVGDGNVATSDAILVFATGIGGSVAVGDAVTVSGLVTEFRPGGAASTNLTTTEITNPTVTPGGPGVAIAQTAIGPGGRVPPTSVIDDDATGDVETSGSFDAATDGIDFWESLEAMLLRVDNPVVVGPRNDFGEVWVLAQDGAGAGVRTIRDGIVISPADFNPERIQLDDEIVPGATPTGNVGDHFTTAAVGVLDYNFANYEILVTSALTRVDGGLEREVARPPTADELTVASFNVENLSPNDTPAKFARLAVADRDNLRAPDIVGVQEIQDNDGTDELDRHVCDADLPAPDRRDPGGRRADVPVPPDRPGRRPGRRSAGRQHPRRVPLPHRPRPRVRRPPGRHLDDGQRRHRQEQQGAAPLQPGPHRSGERRVDTRAASRSRPSSSSGARRSS